MALYGDIDKFFTFDDDSSGSLSLQTSEQQNLLSQDLDEPSSISGPEMSSLSSLSSQIIHSSDSSQEGDETEIKAHQEGGETEIEAHQEGGETEIEAQSSAEAGENSIQRTENGLEWQGFKIVGDNIDKTVRPRHQTTDSQTQSLHYFNSFAVRDRIDFSSYSDISPSVDIETISMDVLLPTQDDLQGLYASFGIHVARVLTRHLSSLSAFADIVPAHIKHKYSSSMAKKSNVVSIVPFSLPVNASNFVWGVLGVS